MPQMQAHTDVIVMDSNYGKHLETRDGSSSVVVSSIMTSTDDVNDISDLPPELCTSSVGQKDRTSRLESSTRMCHFF